MPEARAKAEWLAVNNISVDAVNDSGVYYRCLDGITVRLEDVHLTNRCGGVHVCCCCLPAICPSTKHTPSSLLCHAFRHARHSLGPGYALLPAPSGFGQLQASSVPLIAANSVTNSSDMQVGAGVVPPSWPGGQHLIYLQRMLRRVEKPAHQLFPTLQDLSWLLS